MIGLREVRREPILAWVPDERRADWVEIRDLSGDRNDFDLGLLYDSGRVERIDHLWVHTPHAGSDVRAGLVTMLKSRIAVSPVYFLVALAHWRANSGDVTDAAARRSRAAQALRRAITEMMDIVRPEEPHNKAAGAFIMANIRSIARIEFPIEHPGLGFV